MELVRIFGVCVPTAAATRRLVPMASGDDAATSTPTEDEAKELTIKASVPTGLMPRQAGDYTEAEEIKGRCWRGDLHSGKAAASAAAARC